ncbi:MAG TPA: hypothetical protein VK469_04745 [Candidatus Kapabacteria bacterium]|nr:hypothetical protein [Candidatus Kapabacteria bacterium]
MKRILSIAVCFAVVLLAVNCGSSAAINYNDRIVEYQGKIIEKMIDLSNAFAKADPAEMNAKLKTLQLQIDESLAGISKMEDFKGNFRLRDGAIALIEFYQSIAGTEYAEIINILSMGAENITDMDRERLLEIQKDITEREAQFDKELQAAQKEFATLFDIDMKGNKYQDQIDQMGK